MLVVAATYYRGSVCRPVLSKQNHKHLAAKSTITRQDNIKYQMKGNSQPMTCLDRYRRGDESIASAHSKPGARRIWLGSATLRPLDPRKRHVTNCAGGWVGLCTPRKMLPPPEFDPWTVQPDAIFYTACALLAASVLNNAAINYFLC
jgi:hypothetical protein